MNAHLLTHSRRVALRGLAAGVGLALMLTPPAQADDLQLLIKHGTVGGRFERNGIGLRFGTLWTSMWGPWTAALKPELEFSRLRYSGTADAPHSLDEAGILGVLRVTHPGAGLQAYVEAGLGSALFSHDRLGDKTFSTHFQFSEHVGAGVTLGGRASLGWQFSHYSNADIRLPNDGLDVHQIVLAIRF